MPQMRSRREQVDAHRFITARMNQALVLANPDSVERPLRRIGVSIFASVMIMVLIFGGFAIAALLNKGNDSPQLNHIIVEKGTTSIYVYTYAPDESEEDGDKPKLWPVANYTSALLLLEPYKGDPPKQELKSESLDEYPRGFMVGIPDAPNSPPSPSSLLQDEDWNACSVPREEGSVDSHLITELLVEDLPAPDYLGGEQWMLAQTAVAEGEESDMFLLWNDRKYPIADPGILSALNMTAGDAVSVTEQVLTTIAPGPPLEVEIEDYFGEDSSVLDQDGNVIPFGHTVEQGGNKYVLLQLDDDPELARIGETTEALLEAQFGATVPIAPDELNTVGIEAEYEEPNFPQAMLEAVTIDSDRPAVCSIHDHGTGEEAGLEIGYYTDAPDSLVDAAESVQLNDDGSIESNVDNLQAKVVLPPGSAALIVAEAQPDADVQGISYLVDSLGGRYGLVDEGTTGSTRNLLGYEGVEPVGLPEEMLELIPKVADLNPSEAKQQLDPGGEVPTFDSGADEEE